MSINPRHFSFIKSLILILAYGFLAYMLVTFDSYASVWQEWKQALSSNWFWLVLVLLLLPLNWLLETMKWQVIVQDLQALTLKQAFRAVMGGNTTAFFTPNRLGEFPGRSLFMQEGKRAQSVMLGVFGSLSQTLVIILCGLPAFILFWNLSHISSLSYGFLAAVTFVLLLLLYFYLPQLSAFMLRFRFLKKWETYLQTFIALKRTRLLWVLLIAFFRYLVFCTQFYFMLRFFCVELNWLTATVGIATNYLFVTFAPSWAFSEGAVRASSAVLVLGFFSANLVGIAAAGVLIWLLNFVLPMLAGSYFLSKTKI